MNLQGSIICQWLVWQAYPENMSELVVTALSFVAQSRYYDFPIFTSSIYKGDQEEEIKQYYSVYKTNYLIYYLIKLDNPMHLNVSEPRTMRLLCL